MSKSAKIIVGLMIITGIGLMIYAVHDELERFQARVKSEEIVELPSYTFGNKDLKDITKDVVYDIISCSVLPDQIEIFKYITGEIIVDDIYTPFDMYIKEVYTISDGELKLKSVLQAEVDNE